MASIRTRIAPSPTGHFHIGTARAALFNYLFARRNNGQFILRIEDTDLERSKKEFETEIIAGMRWLGITPDEGPEIGGAHGPYRQSERLLFYVKAIEKLLDDGMAYYCFHDEYFIKNEKEKILGENGSFLHKCEYRDLPLKEALRKKEVITSFVIRFKTPPNRKLIFQDMIRGQVAVSSDILGDFSIAKDVSEPLYNLAVVVDDYEMKITDVIRGEDHISNTPKQMLLQEALGYSAPNYAHLPLILGSDRAKLSKREGASSVDDFRKAGYLPDAMINFLALLGWNPGGQREFFTLLELSQIFSLERVQKAGAVFNGEKLDFINSAYIRAYTADELLPYAMPLFKEAKIPTDDVLWLKKFIALEQGRIKKLSELLEHIVFLLRLPEYDAALLVWKEGSFDDVKRALKTAELLLQGLPKEGLLRENLAKIFFAEIEAGKFKNKGELLWPLRAALSGQQASPGPFEIIEFLGKEEALRRIATALGKIS